MRLSLSYDKHKHIAFGNYNTYSSSMYKINNDQRGISHLLVPILLIVVVVTGFAGYRVLNASESKDSGTVSSNSKKSVAESWPTDTDITWSSGGDGSWITLPYDAKPPACPDPLVLDLPTPDLSKASSILYPGQNRTGGSFDGLGGTYKAHGGIRFQNNPDNNITVVMPFNGSVVSASKDVVEGELQYGFSIVNACGIMISLGHMHDLTPAFQAIADKLPNRPVGDSRATKVEPAVAFKTGDKIATAVGLFNSKNVGFDYGLYDLRSYNQASKDPAYNKAHADTAEKSFHGLCWLDNLNSKDKAAAKALPATDETAGKTSDYCK